MTKFLFSPILVLVALLGANQAKADGLFIEPMLTYELGSESITWPDPLDSSTGSVDGWGVGARIGVHFADIIFLAADGRYSQPQFKDSSTNSSASATAYNYGATLGVQMPIVGLRVWGTWIAGGELNPSQSNGFDFKFTGGTGYRVGAGIQVVFVSLNLEYQHLQYGTTTIEQAGPLAPNLTSNSTNLTDNAWIASVSFPIAL